MVDTTCFGDLSPRGCRAPSPAMTTPVRFAIDASARRSFCCASPYESRGKFATRADWHTTAMIDYCCECLKI